MNDTIEKRLKQIIKYKEEKEELNPKNLTTKIFLIILLLFIVTEDGEE